MSWDALGAIAGAISVVLAVVGVALAYLQVRGQIRTLHPDSTTAAADASLPIGRIRESLRPILSALGLWFMAAMLQLPARSWWGWAMIVMMIGLYSLEVFVTTVGWRPAIRTFRILRWLLPPRLRRTLKVPDLPRPPSSWQRLIAAGQVVGILIILQIAGVPTAHFFVNVLVHLGRNVLKGPPTHCPSAPDAWICW
ncbi:hypothetical protein [Nonomuraea rhodomycinica]|uniref:Uncharacterized protein n=1 Tax=Nonomuraea rhodomycinica TaxID=1712872 RepID=A0A7Y6IJ08_9ACTN|nr:hypothetical protein [Nonomuraea rhodomycinica]NUW39086.1 hypothetical protein [Nonomuraea rhodomycinica]